MDNNINTNSDLFKKIDRFQEYYKRIYGDLPSEEEIVELVKKAKTEHVNKDEDYDNRQG